MTRTVEEALALLKRTKTDLINEAREIAVRICFERGEVHSRLVRGEMAKRSRLSGENERWLGAVFADPIFESTGRTVMVDDDERNIHRGRVVKVWRLRSPGAAKSMSLQEEVSLLRRQLAELQEKYDALERKRSGWEPEP